jgi:hypothetical protein
MNITNRQRLDYLLDWLAESFPEQAQLKSCNCGSDGTRVIASSGVAAGRFPSKRELIEDSLLQGMQAQNPNWVESSSISFSEALDNLDDTQIGRFLKFVPVDLIDRHLNDLALFMNPQRHTSLQEIKEWDKRHANDFSQVQF